MNRTINIFLDKLISRTCLTAGECHAIRALGGTLEELAPHQSFVLIGDEASSITLILDGLCGRVETPVDDKRQITAIYVEGDVPDLCSAFEPQANASMEALTAATIVRIPHAAIRILLRDFPAVGEAFTRYLVADGAITTEWLTNVGSRQARAGLAHLFCEMAVRLAKVDGDSFSFSFPLSQQQLGEACGISTVHINRSAMSLRREGLMQLDRGVVRIFKWRGLKMAGNFSGDYLASGTPRRLAS